MKNTNSLITIDSAFIKKMFFLFISTIIFLTCNLLLYNFSQANSNFMKHPIWRKMFFVLFILLIVSFTFFIILFVTTSFSDVIQNQLWMIYIIIYYFAFFLNLFILSIIHVLFFKKLNSKEKIIMTWLVSSVLIGLIISFL